MSHKFKVTDSADAVLVVEVPDGGLIVFVDSDGAEIHRSPAEELKRVTVVRPSRGATLSRATGERVPTNSTGLRNRQPSRITRSTQR